ncbi:hypothetical protein P7C73_g5031, partial [Tremellales sp. Uapishka_1]
MRGEHCIAGASILSGIAVILLVFANIGQISSGALVSGIHMVEVNVAAYGNAYVGVKNGTAAGLYDSSTKDKMGTEKGLRQYYRYGLYNSCGYQKGGGGICNSTIFGYPFEPLSQILADTPTKYKTATDAFIPSSASTFRDNGFNHGLSRAGSLMIFVGSVAALLSLIFGVVKHRLAFFVASICAGISALLLMIGAAMWTSIIAKDAFINIVKVQYGYNLGIDVYAGPALYLTWVAFAMIALSILPYVIACCTFRK